MCRFVGCLYKIKEHYAYTQRTVQDLFGIAMVMHLNDNFLNIYLICMHGFDNNLIILRRVSSSRHFSLQKMYFIGIFLRFFLAYMYVFNLLPLLNSIAKGCHIIELNTINKILINRYQRGRDVDKQILTYILQQYFILT